MQGTYCGVDLGWSWSEEEPEDKKKEKRKRNGENPEWPFQHMPATNEDLSLKNFHFK